MCAVHEKMVHLGYILSRNRANALCGAFPVKGVTVKITVPDYYPKFRCIAGACTDTCCAGWDVDVDAAAYGRYQKIIEDENTPIARRLKEACVPGEDGGCTFRLRENLRCPFLNRDNLCDLITAKGESVLCDTCADFPRFKTAYGNRLETGLAPSCITAAQIMLSSPLPFTLVSGGEDGRSPEENDIDPQTFFRLRQIRGDYLARLNDTATDIASALRFGLCGLTPDKDSAADVTAAGSEAYRNTEEHLLDDFPGMEIINPDWRLVQQREQKLREHLKKSPAGEWGRLLHSMYAGTPALDAEARQIAAYDVYRYLLPAVYTGDELCRRKIAAFTYLVTQRMYAGYYFAQGNLPFSARVDLQHLWSRQFEHSYVNFRHYSRLLSGSARYSRHRLAAVLAREQLERGGGLPRFVVAGMQIPRMQDEIQLRRMLDRFEALLPYGERLRAAGIRRLSDRVLSVAGRLLYEELRSRFLSGGTVEEAEGDFFLTPEELAGRIAARRSAGENFPPVRQGRNGKPMDALETVHLSIAHSRTAVVCAVSDRCCGIDLEDKNRKTSRMLEKIFTDAELEELKGLVGGARMRRMVMLFTRAEAEVKLTGEGIGGLRARKQKTNGNLILTEELKGHFISLAFSR